VGVTIGILAGEASGDELGRGLMAQLKLLHPGARFVGIGGPGMLAEGLESLASMDRLAVNGFIDPLKRLPALVRLLRLLLRHYERERPDVFVGVDFNVFNLLLEGRLKRRGIPTVHYVSPSVYAWRRGRVTRIARAVDVLLALYPFEASYYAGTRVRVEYVGHPLADAIDVDDGGEAARRAARRQLHVPADAAPLVALLPGSRTAEIRQLGDTFLAAGAAIARQRPGACFVVPCVRPVISAWLEAARRRYPDLRLVTYQGNARLALTACDGAIVKSGTSTLEAMLLGRPMVVSYRLGWLSYRIVRRLLKTPYIAMPNILAGRQLVPELIQDAATPDRLANALLAELDKAQGNAEYLREFARLHRILRRHADARAAEVIASLLSAPRPRPETGPTPG
jgi:lipid-A-disaccharide synthase